MDRATLAAQHPELLAEILAEGKAQAMAERSFSAEHFLACVKPFVAADAFARAENFFKSCASAQLTPEQMAKLAPVMVVAEAPKAEEPKAEEPKADGARSAILAQLQAQQAKGVPADNSNPDAKAALREARRKAAAAM